MNIENFYTDHETHCPVWPDKNSCETNEEYQNKIFLELKKMLPDDVYNSFKNSENLDDLDDYINFLENDEKGIQINTNISKFETCDTFLEKLTEFFEIGIPKDNLNKLKENIKNLNNEIYTNAGIMNENRTNRKDKQETEFIREYRLETSDNNITKLRLKYIIFIVLIFILLIIEFVLIFL